MRLGEAADVCCSAANSRIEHLDTNFDAGALRMIEYQLSRVEIGCVKLVAYEGTIGRKTDGTRKTIGEESPKTLLIEHNQRRAVKLLARRKL